MVLPVSLVAARSWPEDRARSLVRPQRQVVGVEALAGEPRAEDLEQLVVGTEHSAIALLPDSSSAAFFTLAWS